MIYVVLLLLCIGTNFITGEWRKAKNDDEIGLGLLTPIQLQYATVFLVISWIFLIRFNAEYLFRWDFILSLIVTNVMVYMGLFSSRGPK